MKATTESNEMQMQRSLKPRHMVSIGGAIGTGLFVATGSSLSTAGPGGALVAYGIIGIMVYFLMTSLGEMATHLPVAGSFETYATRYVDSALGFALGWNYWYNWAITVACELVAGVIVIKFWFPNASEFLVCTLFLALLFGLNYYSARSYGESEFWFAGIKVVTIIIFLVVGVLMIFGILGGHSPGFANWTLKDAPFVGGAMATINIFMIAGFSFGGVEIVAVASGESEDPTKNVPKAIKTIFWRIMLFYIGAIAIIGFLLPYTDPNLLRSSLENVAVSPFTLIFERAGLAAAASIMNAVILTSILSCGNSSLYVSSRMLYALAKEGKAPAIFGRLNKRGVPVIALIATTVIGAACFLTTSFGEGVVYNWLVNAAGLAGFITWFGIAICHFKFRKAFIAQGHDLSELKFKAKFYPFGPIFAMALCLFVTLGQNYGAFLGDTIDWQGLLVSYIGLPLVLILYIVYKIVKKTKWIKPEDADLSSAEN
ncbi:MAG TPA: amino acid permease [Bacillota bacterium]|nr:amino acid permease [Bacillota bacterium]